MEQTPYDDKNKVNKENKRDLAVYQPDPPKGRILVVSGDEPFKHLEEAFQFLGMKWDVCSSLQKAREIFFAWGGHEGLLICPDTKVSIARTIVYAIRDMDPSIPVFTFIDPQTLGNLHPKPISLAEIKLATMLGKKVFKKTISTCLRKARV